MEGHNEQFLAEIFPHLNAIREIVNDYKFPGYFNFTCDTTGYMTAYGVRAGFHYTEMGEEDDVDE